MAEKFQALKKALEIDPHFPDEFWGNAEPRCPHCGEACKVSDNEWWNLYEEGEHEVECPHCEGEFTVSTRVSFSFNTDEQGAMDDEDDDADSGEASNG